jgi:hypothetical protein
MVAGQLTEIGMNEELAKKIAKKGKAFTPTYSSAEAILMTQALAAVVAAQPDDQQRAQFVELIARLLGDEELADEAVSAAEEQLQQFTLMLDQPTEIGDKAFNYKYQRWDEPFDLESVSDETAKEYIPQDEFTLRTYDRVRKRHKSKYEALTAALQPHLDQDSSEDK